jgi:hypothetical protein
MEKNRTDSGMYRWFAPVIRPGFVFDSKPIAFGEVFYIFFMQRWERQAKPGATC